MMRTQQPAQKEVMVRHWSVKDESNASWSICMYTYLRNIGPPFLHGVFLFSKVWVSNSKLWWLSYSCLLEPHLVILTSGKGITWAYFFAHKSLSEELSSLHNVSYFLRKGIMEPTLCVLLDCPSFDHAASVCLGFSLGTRLCEMRFGYLQGVVFTMNFWNFKVILEKKSFWCLFKTNLFWKIQAILMDRFA